MPDILTPGGTIQGEDDSLTTSFHSAWHRFAAECGPTVAPEATYQAWFAHFLIEAFGVLRVVREVDFGASYLLDPADRTRFAGHNLMTDVMVLREPTVDLPRRAWLAKKGDPDERLRSGLGRLGRFGVVCELKVGASQGSGVPPAHILRDGHKLDALARAAAHHFPNHPMPQFAVCVLDNHPKRHLDVAALRTRWEKLFPERRVELVVASTMASRRQGMAGSK